MSIRLFWHKSLEWSSKFLLLSFLDGVTRLAEELAVPDVVVGAVQHLVAHGALEAALVPLEAPGQPLLRSIH